MKWEWVWVGKGDMGVEEKGTHNKTKLTGRAVLLANSHTGEGPARETGPNLRLLEAGRPESGERSGPFSYFLLCGQCAQGALLGLMLLLGPRAPQAPALKLCGAVPVGHAFEVGTCGVSDAGWGLPAVVLVGPTMAVGPEPASGMHGWFHGRQKGGCGCGLFVGVC